jgi:hypothetical protein
MPTFVLITQGVETKLKDALSCLKSNRVAKAFAGQKPRTGAAKV